MAAVAALAAANASAAVVMLTGIEMRGEVGESRCLDERRKYGVFIKLKSQKGNAHEPRVTEKRRYI
jgi:hypothetical protein